MLALWPWALVSPLLNPLRALYEFTHFPSWAGVVQLNGEVFNRLTVPRSYLPIYFAVQLPEIVLLLIVAAPVAAIATGRCAWRAGRQQEVAVVGIVALAIALPIAVQIAFNTLEYNATRHFTFVLPPLAVLLGPVFAGGLRWLAAQPRLFRDAGYAGLLGYALFHIFLMGRLHPYEYIYFNGLVGGVSGANGRYDLEYWSTANREATNALASYLHREGRDGRPYIVAVCPAPRPAAVYFPENFHLPERDDTADFLIVLSPGLYVAIDHRCSLPGAGHEIASVSRFGVPLAVIEDLRRSTAP
jgi:hypothetical protein